jgi:hypothetical protein
MIFAASVVVLFLLSSAVSGIQNSSQKDERVPVNQDNISVNTDAVITCYVDGKPNSQTLSYDSGVYLKKLFSELAFANAHDPSSMKTQELQQQILQYAEQQDLLPKGFSVDVFLNQLQQQSQRISSKNIGGGVPLGVGREMFCNFVATGQGSAFPIIILPRFIPFIMAPIPRLFVGWKTPMGITSCGGLVSRTGFYAVGPQQGFALGFWGIGFSIFLPPVMAYGMFGYALFAKATAEYMEFYPPNHPPEISAVYPLDGAGYVPLSTSELRFSLSDYDGDPMSYSVSTYPDVGGGNGNLKPDGTYTVPISDLKSSTKYSWYVSASDGMDTVEDEFSFTTEAVAPVVSDERPLDGDRYVPETQASLSFHLRDPQNDLMSYTVQTSPFIGSGGGSDVGEGDIIVPINGLELLTEYRWFVNVTDGENPISEMFWFRTGPLMVFDPFMEGWGYRKMITVNHSMVAGNLEHFPVLLSFTDSDLRDKAQDDGDDILFMDGVGVATRLYHEIEEFDGASGRLVAWVNVSSLSPASDTVFYMYYGNMGSADQQCPEKVWDSNYKIVYHLKDLTSSSVGDSTANNNKGTKKGGNEPNQEDGKIGKGQYFDYVDDRIDISSPEGIALTQYTLSAYINLDQLTDCSTIAQSFYYKAAGLYYGYSFRTVGSSIQVANLNGGGWAEANQYITGNVLTQQQWYYITATYDGTTARVYVNGSLIGSKTLPTPIYDLIKRGFIGVSDKLGGSYGYYMDGKLDEIRISSSIRSGDWILTEYNNQNNPSGFFDIGIEEPHR